MGDDFQCFPFGSAHIGTTTYDSDIDIVVGCLNGKTIDDCRKALDDTKITILGQVMTTIPLLKVEIDDTPVDLIFAEFERKATPDTLLMECIKPTEANARAVNGVLVSDWLIENIPNFEEFCQVVKSVKLWALTMNIYGTMLGYPGGMAWTLMVAKIFQEYDTSKMSVERIEDLFFRYYRRWNWPAPVILAPRDDSQKQYKNWNPYRYPRDQCFMAVITPVYPTMNSTYCVTEAALKHIELCFRDMTDKVYWDDYNPKNWINFRIERPEDDDTFKLQLKALCSKIYEREKVVYVYPFTYFGQQYIKVFYCGDLNLDDVFDGFNYRYVNQDVSQW